MKYELTNKPPVTVNDLNNLWIKEKEGSVTKITNVCVCGHFISLYYLNISIKKETIMKQKHPGISIRRNSIVIEFRYKGSRCREILSIPPTNENIRRAVDILAARKRDIASM